MKERKVVAEVSVVPLGTGSAGVSEYVADCIGILEANKEVIYRMTPMGTIVEGTLGEVLKVTQQMHDAPFRKGAARLCFKKPCPGIICSPNYERNSEGAHSGILGE